MQTPLSIARPSNGQITKTVTGQYLAKAHLTRRQRARLAADLSNGMAAAYPLTVKQAASILKVPLLDVTKARANGKRADGRANGHATETLAQHMERTTAAEWQEAARIYGVDRVWDLMISPIIAEEREVVP